MAVYNVTAPDGTKLKLEGPPGATPEQIGAAAQAAYAARAKSAPTGEPSGRPIVSFERGPSVAQAPEAEPMELEITGGQTVSPEEYAKQYPGAKIPETTTAGLAGAVTRGIAPAAVMAGLGALAAPVAGVPIAVGAGLGAAALGASQLLGLDRPFVEQLQGLLSRAGVAEPQTATERLLQAAAGGVSSGVGGVAAGQAMMKSAAPIVRTAGAMLSEAPASQIAADIAGSSSAQAAAELGLGPGGQIVAAIVGGGLGGRVGAGPQPGAIPKAPITPEEFGGLAKTATAGGLGAERATQKIVKAVRPSAEVLESAERLGITEYLQPDHITTNQVVREISQAVKSMPGSEARRVEMEGLAKVGERAKKLIDEFGGTDDLSTLSTDVKARMGSTIKDLETKAEGAYKKIRQALPDDTRGKADITLQFLRDRAKAREAMPGSGGLEGLSSLERELVNRLTPVRVASASGKSFKEIPPTYATIDDLRKEVGDGLKNRGPFKDANTGLLGEIYGKLTEDQGRLAASKGAADLWEEAKGYVKTRKAVEDDMSSIFGKKLDESLVTNFLTSTNVMQKGDVDRFVNMIGKIPAEMRQKVVASAVGSAFGNAIKNGDLNFNTFDKWWTGISKNKQAQTALFANLPPEARQSFKDLGTVAGSIAKATRENIANGRTKAAQDQIAAADNMVTAIYDIASKAAIGLPIEAASRAAGVPNLGIAAGLMKALTGGRTTAIEAADAFIKSPQFMRAVLSAEDPTRQQAAIQTAASSGAFRRFADAVNIPRAMSDRELFIRNALLAGATEEAQAPQEQTQ